MMDIKSPIESHLMRLAAAGAVLASPTHVFAQMCPACYSNAAAQTPGLLQALKTGILVMMFPSLLMFIMIFVVVFRRRNSFNTESDGEMNFDRDSRTVVAPDMSRASAKT